MEERCYIDEECQGCGTDCGSRLCDDCKEDTEEMLFTLLDDMSPERRGYLSMCLDGVYLSDWYYMMKARKEE